MIAVSDKVRLVRLVSVASPEMKRWVGEVGTVQHVGTVNGRLKYTVCFAVGWDGAERECFLVYGEEIEAA